MLILQMLRQKRMWKCSKLRFTGEGQLGTSGQKVISRDVEEMHMNGHFVKEFVGGSPTLAEPGRALSAWHSTQQGL